MTTVLVHHMKRKKRDEKKKKVFFLVLTDILDASVECVVHPLGDGNLLADARVHLPPLFPRPCKSILVYKAIQLLRTRHLIITYRAKNTGEVKL